ncbi:LacI family DNA-binding transcriptional regulator [Lachnoclostridium phytofermentans]|nr:LacI family DNA-binding transcriptional regulator [Lachnoclostridium phytofermentans]
MQNLTFKDVAQLADVSVSTVSKVINDHPYVHKNKEKSQ